MTLNIEYEKYLHADMMHRQRSDGGPTCSQSGYATSTNACSDSQVQHAGNIERVE